MSVGYTKWQRNLFLVDRYFIFNYIIYNYILYKYTVIKNSIVMMMLFELFFTQKKKKIFRVKKYNNSKNITIAIFTSKLAYIFLTLIIKNSVEPEAITLGKLSNFEPAVNIAAEEINDKDILRMCKYLKLNRDQLRKMQPQIM